MPKDNMNQSSSVDSNATTSSVNNNNNSNSYSAVNNNQKSEQQDSNKKAAKVAAKGAATYFAGPEGAAAVDALAKTKAGDKILNKGGEALNKIPGMSKATKKLDDSGALDAADKGLSMVGGASGGASGAEATISTKQIAGENSTGDVASQSPDNSSLQNMSNPLGKGLGGLGGKKGGLLQPSSTSDDEKNTEESSSEQDNGDFFSQVSGFGFIDKKKIILYVVVAIIPFLFIGLVISFIGGADDEDEQAGAQESGRDGYVDKEGAKGTRYERYIKGYNESSTSTGGSNCTYNIKGATNGQTSVKYEQQISNLKVRLMHSSFCDGTDNTPIEGESLVDFETYILGVVYAEVGGGHNKAHAQAQAVTARSFILDRAIRGGNRSNGVKLEQENGQWILQVRNCVADQVFCNPDQGCSKRGDKSNQYLDVYSGVNKTVTYKSPLSADSKSRSWVAETSGQVLSTKEGYVVGTNYASKQQAEWAKLGENYDYKQILLKQYGSNKQILTASCSGGSTTASTGDYTSWKQYGAPWSSIRLGSSNNTIQSAGCLATSISMLVAKSGVSTNVSGELNPGTFVQALSKNGGFTNSGNLQWNAIAKVAPQFVWTGNEGILGKSKSEKLNKIKSLQDSGYYVVAEVKGNTGQHWVAVDSISGNTINMMDPGSTSTNMWQQYQWKNTSRVVWFKAG